MTCAHLTSPTADLDSREGRDRRLAWHVLAALLALALLRATPAFAAGVVGTGTPASCTEAALDAALVGGGTVTFDCGRDPFTVILTSEKVFTAETTTTVDGGGLVTLSGGDAVRVFRVNKSAMLALHNLGVAHGHGEDAGGVSTDGILTAVHSTFTGNSGYAAGAIWSSGSLSVDNSIFTGNSGVILGGIRTAGDGTTTVTNSTFYGNAHGVLSLQGSDIASLKVENSSFSGNDGGCGAAIFQDRGTLTAINSTFSSNRGTGYGGAICSISGTVAVTNCDFFSNASSLEGGGIYKLGGTLTVTNSSFSGNAKGAISFSGDSLLVDNSTFTGNTADSGGGICARGGAVTITNSTFTGNVAEYGGGIQGFGTPLTVSNCTFSGNTATIGGGIMLGSRGTPTVTNSTIVGNTATFEGGGIANGTCYGPPTMTSCPGGAALSVINSTLFDNSAPLGGGISHAGGTAALTITNSIIANGGCVSDGTSTDGGHNLIDDAENACDLVNGMNGNIVGVDPLLDPMGLQDNGGPTQTIALLPGSPAINAGDPDVCISPPVSGIDQRWHARPGAGSVNCSIGAYEYNSALIATPLPTPTSTPTVTPTPIATPTPTPTPQPSGDGGGGGCTVTPTHSSAAWWLLVPAMAQWWARRRWRG